MNPHSVSTSRSRIKTWLKCHWPAMVFILLGLCLRLQKINQPLCDTFSWRQASTAMIAENFYRRNPNIFYPEVSWTGPGPNYQGREFQTVTYLASLLYRVFGQHDWIGRGISVAFSVLGMIALYGLVRRVWDPSRAFVALAIYATLPGAIFIDRSFLPDPAMLALAVTATWLAVIYLQSDALWALLLFAPVLTLALLTKPFCAPILLSIAYATFAIPRHRAVSIWPRLVRISFAFFVALPLFFGYYAWARHLALTYPPYHFSGAQGWIWKEPLTDWLAEGYFLRETFVSFRWWMWGSVVLTLCTLGLLVHPGAFYKPRSHDDCRPSAPWIFHVWAAGCAMLYIVGARELLSNPWNFHIFNPVAAAMAANLLQIYSARSRRPRRVWTLSAAVLIAAYLLWAGRAPLRQNFIAWDKNSIESYRLGLALREISSEGDLVVTVAFDVGDPVAIYYSRRRGWVFPVAHMQELLDDWSLLPKDEILVLMLEDVRGRGAKWLGIAEHHRDDHRPTHNLWQHRRRFVVHLENTCPLVKQTSDYRIYQIPSLDPSSGPDYDAR